MKASELRVVWDAYKSHDEDVLCRTIEIQGITHSAVMAYARLEALAESTGLSIDDLLRRCERPGVGEMSDEALGKLIDRAVPRGPFDWEEAARRLKAAVAVPQPPIQINCPPLCPKCARLHYDNDPCAVPQPLKPLDREAVREWLRTFRYNDDIVPSPRTHDRLADAICREFGVPQPAQPWPEREELAQKLFYEWAGSAPDFIRRGVPWSSLTEKHRDDWRHTADYVLSLVPPVPASEPWPWMSADGKRINIGDTVWLPAGNGENYWTVKRAVVNSLHGDGRIHGGTTMIASDLYLDPAAAQKRLAEMMQD